MLLVFVSSIQNGYGDVRDAVRRAIESLDMRALMAESAGAHAESPQRALLDLVARADVFLLIVGSRYSGPTEDEFNEARRLGKPILVLRQNCELEPAQAEFLERVAAGWKGGRLWDTFNDATDIPLAAVRALTNVDGGREDLAPAARARASALAVGKDDGQTGSTARVSFVPLVATVLLDAVALDRPDLQDMIGDLVRSHRVVDHNIGIGINVTREGVSVVPSGGHAGGSPVVFVGSDGSIVCVIDVGGDGNFGFSLVDAGRLSAGIATAGGFALDVWAQIDEREDVQQVAVAVAIPGAQHKVFGTPTNPNSLSMGWGMPPTVLVPDPPIVIRRGEIGGDALSDRLVAEIKRVFADAGALAR